MSTTIKNIANKLDLSPSTVSKILTDKYKSNKIIISPHTVELVKATAKDMNYKPNNIARMLHTGKTKTIGIYFSEAKEHGFHLTPYHAGLLENIEKDIIHLGYDILLINYKSIIEEFEVNRIDGLLVIVQTEKGREDLERLLEEKHPFVVINDERSLPRSSVPAVNINNTSAVTKIVRQLKEFGHTKIAFLGNLDQLVLKELHDRMISFQESLRSARMPVDKDLFLLGPQPGLPQITTYINNGYQGMKWLREVIRKDFTAVFCVNDKIAYGALQYLYEKGIKVPEEVSVIGFDNIPDSEDLYGGVSTVKQPLDTMAGKAVEKLFLMMEDKLSKKDYETMIEPELILRRSLSHAPVAGKAISQERFSPH